MNDRDNRSTRPSPKMPDDASIPVLTERLTMPVFELDIPVAQALTPEAPRSAAAITKPVLQEAPRTAAPAVDSSASPTAASLALRAAAGAQLDDFPATQPIAAQPTWPRIEAELRESVLRELRAQVPDELDRQLRDRLTPAINQAVVSLAAQFRITLDASLRELVNRAVANEIARLRTPPK